MATYTELYIDQGSDFTFNIDLDKDIDLTGYTAVGQIRRCWGSTDPIDFDLFINPTPGDPELTATLTSAQTALLRRGRYLFDIEIRSGDPTPIVTRVLEGQIYVNPRVTNVP